MLRKIIFSFSLVVIFAAFGFAKLSFAMTITPVRYEIEGNPGETITKEMTIVNDDKAPVTYYSSYANFEAQGESGSAAFIEPKDDIGTWIKTNDSIYLNPGEQKTVSFSISIPSNAEPGGHFGVIFWGNSPENDNGGKQLAVSAKTGLIILLSVKGDVKESGGLINFNTKEGKFWYNTLPVSFEYRFRNDGGDRIKPAGKISIRSFLFIPVKRLDANPMNGNILPDSTRRFSIDWVRNPRPEDYKMPSLIIGKFFSDASYQWKNFALGIYLAKLNINYGLHNQSDSRSVVFFVFPWQLIICLVIIIILIVFLGRKLIKRYNNYIINKANSTLGTPDTGSHE